MWQCQKLRPNNLVNRGKYDKVQLLMKYLSIFFTILFIWIAVLLIALTRDSATEIFQLYLAVMVSTAILFLIGFAKK